MTVQTELKQRRAALGLTQAALGTLLGVPQATIARWENGTRRMEHATMIDLALCHLEGRDRTFQRAEFTVIYPGDGERGSYSRTAYLTVGEALAARDRYNAAHPRAIPAWIVDDTTGEEIDREGAYAFDQG